MAMTREKQLIELLILRLERISSDSCFAHRASGIRGSLIKAYEGSEVHTSMENDAVDKLISTAFAILVDSVKEKNRN